MKFINFIILTIIVLICGANIEVDEGLANKFQSNNVCDGNGNIATSGTIIGSGINYRHRDTYTIETLDGCQAIFETNNRKFDVFQVGDNITFKAQMTGGFGKLTQITSNQQLCTHLQFHHDAFRYDGQGQYHYSDGELVFKLNQIRKFRKLHGKQSAIFTTWNVCRNSNGIVTGMTLIN